MANIREEKAITIYFAGDSGDGIQLTGNQFTNTAALIGNDTRTFPNFPAEIRAPQGTIGGVSGFQLRFGGTKIYTPGDNYDVLVAMNAAALKSNIDKLAKGGLIITNSDGFDNRNLKLAKYDKDKNPLTDGTLDNYKVLNVNIKQITRDALKDSQLSVKEIDRSKNMFVLGMLYWIYNRPIANTLNFLKQKFGVENKIYLANEKLLKAGYNYGETAEFFSVNPRYNIGPAPMPKNVYRNITGNQALALGLIAGITKAGVRGLYGTYPITPASDILHELSKHKKYGLYTYQAEDEIAAICAAIGASFGGDLGMTASSGPGIALKGEAMGLAVSLEIPLIIVNVQRGGPSTGLPTKTEQSDLNQALYGRNGETPMPVLATSSPSDCFDIAFEACRIAIEYMTPVIILSDGYIANASLPWSPPKANTLKEIKPLWATKNNNPDGPFLPYLRNINGVRPWATPGTLGLEHRIGGLEKEDKTGNVSYDPKNHEKMTQLRAQKVKNIEKTIPKQTIALGEETGDVLILGWGSTYGVIQSSTTKMIEMGWRVSHAHLKYINPLPTNISEVIGKFKHVLIPELNMGQLLYYIRGQLLVDAKGLSKVQGLPLYDDEIINKVKTLL